MNILNFDIKGISVFCRKSYLTDCYYKLNRDNFTFSQFIFLSGGKEIIEKLSNKKLFEIPEFLEKYFTSETNLSFESDGIIFYIDELSIDNSAEIKRLEKLRQSILDKLNNAAFISRAPENVVELERKKLKDTDEKLNLLK